MTQKSGLQHEIEEKLDFVLENVEDATDEDVARAYLKFKEEATKRYEAAQGIDREVNLELNVGDLLTRRRIADDILSNGMEYTDGPDEPWHYGSLVIRRYDDGDNFAGPYITIKDFDGKSWGVIQLQKMDGPEELQQELDEREQEVYEDL